MFITLESENSGSMSGVVYVLTALTAITMRTQLQSAVTTASHKYMSPGSEILEVVLEQAEGSWYLLEAVDLATWPDEF